MTSTTTLGFALIGLLHKGPLSGYDLRKIFQTTPMGHYSSSPGAIYPALRRLEEQGLVSGSVERGQSLRPRKTFRPTRRGTQALRAWLAQPVTRDDVVFNLDVLLLRFAFMGNLSDAEETRRFLQSLVKELEGYVE
jgi:DNA-binding PadR family transcriptional regulator